MQKIIIKLINCSFIVLLTIFKPVSVKPRLTKPNIYGR